MSDRRPFARTLGIDFGLRRVGAAVSDPGRSIATPLEVYERRDAAQDARHYRKLVEENEIDRVVIGLPVHTSGQEGELAAKAREWGGWLITITGLPVFYFDERYTSKLADEILIGSGFKRQKRKGLRDMLAAQILLQGYLDAGCPETESLLQPLVDSEDEETTP
ncbi:MAG: Holliday junction resolvase RuvX [Paludisphaera borealis]|uniref:Holliday junction resolvase RuvX n=1 Tax=Paludisphaera borealis TaxID=1387353 RepID=UPI00284117D8|nr:Holliday junction resolvase RuvX [Paludisphaera borealis]MDR3621812.1 Holliday junction resolvase RuvX [Paludisphaera borealis]